MPAERSDGSAHKRAASRVQAKRLGCVDIENGEVPEVYAAVRTLRRRVSLACRKKVCRTEDNKSDLTGGEQKRRSNDL